MPATINSTGSDGPRFDPGSARDLERTILRMATKARRAGARLTSMSFGEDPRPEDFGWWVLAVGEPLEPEDFQARERARELLREAVERSGIHLAEYVWVWDDADRAQLVITTVPTRERAETVAARLREKGLDVRVSRERF